MHLVCQQKYFLEAILVVQKAISPQHTLPILGNILLKAEGQKLHLSATNLEIAITTSLPAEIKNEGKVTIPAKILGNYISLLKEGDIEIKLEDGETISLKAPGTKTKIKGISPEDFPTIPIVENQESFTVSGEDFKKSIEEIIFCCSSTTTRPVLSGVYLYGKESEIRLVATDSYRLGEKKIKLEKKKFSEELRNIIPAKTMLELSRILALKKEENLEVVTSKNQILFRIGNIELISRLIEGKFPEYQQIIPKESKVTVKTNISDFLLGIKRVALFARENNNNIKFHFSGSKITLTTDATEIGSEESEIPAEITGNDVTTALNGQYVLDVLQCISTEDAVLELQEKLTPVVIKPEKDENLIHVIMPLKI